MFFIALFGLFCAAFSGFVYGHLLASSGVTLDNFGHNKWRIRIIVTLFSGFTFMLWFFIRNPEFLPLQVSIRLPGLSWFMLRCFLFFLVFLALPLSFKSPRKRIYPAILMGFILCSNLFIKKSEAYVLSPFPAELISQRISEHGVILQSTQVTCTPAALANLLPNLDRKCSEKECARVLNTRRFGTTEADLLAGLKKFGLNGYRVSVNAQYLQRMNRPAIIKIWSGRARHSLAVYGRDPNGELIYIDPESGFIKIHSQDLNKALIDGKGVVISSDPALNVNESSPRQLILAIQQILLQEHYLKSQTAHYDLETRQAIMKFQQDYQIEATGYVDPQTYLLLTGPYINKYTLKKIYREQGLYSSNHHD